MFSAPVEATVVVPVPVITPPVPRKAALTVRLPVPVSGPPLRARLLALDAAATDSEPAEMVRVPLLVKLLMFCCPPERVTEKAVPIQALSLGPGRPGFQLPVVCHNPSPAAPVQLTVHCANAISGTETAATTSMPNARRFKATLRQ